MPSDKASSHLLNTYSAVLGTRRSANLWFAQLLTVQAGVQILNSDLCVLIHLTVCVLLDFSVKHHYYEWGEYILEADVSKTALT